MSKSEYWDKVMQRRLSRRSLVQAGAVAGGGLWLGSTLGCGGGSNPQATRPANTPAGGAAAATPQPKRGGTLRVCGASEPNGFDPHLETAGGSFAITLGYNGVLTFNTEGTKPILDLADSLEQPDDVTYIFKLKQGVKYHNIAPVNGREFTADDVKFSIERQMTDKPGKFNHAAFFLGKVGKIDVVDRYTVKFTSNYPDATFLNYMGSPWTKMIAREAVDKYTELNDVIIGTGPFMLTKHEKSVELVMSRNPDYFKKGLPYLDAISSRIIPDPSTQTAAFLGGELDALVPQVTDEDTVKKAKPNYPTQTHTSIYPMLFRVRPYDDKHPPKPPFSDIRVRKAIQLALSKQECIDAVYPGHGVPLVGQLPPDRAPWALPQSDMIKQDIPKAKQLLAEAGYPSGFKSEIYTMTTWMYSDTAQVIKGQLAKIGIDAEIKMLETAAYYTKVYSYDYDMNVHVMLGSEEPEEYLRPYFGVAATFFRWGNQDIQAKIEAQNKILDQQKRVQAILDIQRMLLDDAPQSTLYVATYTVFLDPRVQNYNPSWNTFNFNWDEAVWLSS